MRGHKGLLLAAVILIGTGLVGGAVTTALIGRSLSSRPEVGRRGAGSRPPLDSGRFSSAGERIYYTGIGHDGPIRVRWDPSGGTRGYGGMMGRRGRQSGYLRMGCVRCHREDGQGGLIGMMGGGAEAPDIRYSTLSEGGPEPGEDESSTVEVGWTDEDIARAIRDGIEPDGEELDPLMPRWRMDATDMRDTIDYLKELSDR